MRLACPNCDAKYEVPDDAIPEGGRDVQCSNCGHAWFQLPPEAELAAAEEAELYGDDVDAPAAAPAEDGIGAAIAATMAAPAAAPGPEEDDLDPPDTAPAPRRAMDDAVLNVLREEAERETEARRQEAERDARRADRGRAEAEDQMQVQPDLGMADAAAGGLSPTQRRLAMLRGEDPDAPPPEPMRPPARRDLLPNVEEITSTLQPGEDHEADQRIDALPDLTKGRFGFRTGFFLVIFLLVVAGVVYVAAPSLSAAIPALDGPLAAYVTFVDGLRDWLDGIMNQATQALSDPPQGG